MKTKTPCPKPEDLRHLIDGSLPESLQSECAMHLEDCTGCRQQLEVIATGGTNLSQLLEHLPADEPVMDSAYWRAMKSLDAEGMQTLVPVRRAARRVDDSLTFLQPPQDQAYLGRLEQFDIMGILGRGGMGIVLEAFDSRLQRHVAIKVLDPELANDETSRQRFCREARAAASVTHENVVAIHQVERSGDDKLPYLVMQLISGETLEERLNKVGRFPLREIVRIGMQASHGLAAAHAKGLIHRDIKPGNILLEPPHDHVKLTDFGLARVTEEARLTRTGIVSGTPLYMAPEQAHGEEADQRADLFSLGAVLYEMATGRPPFSGNSALAILKQIAETRQRPARELNPEIPLWLSETIDQLLEKRPIDRIQSAAQLAELLEYEWALMKTNSDEVPQVCEIEERKRTIRARWLGLLVAVTFLGLGMAAGGIFARRPASSHETTVPPLAVLSASAGPIEAVAIDPSGHSVAMGVEDGQVRLWDLPTRSIKATLQAHRGSIWSAKFASKGELLATGGDDRFARLWDVNQSEPLREFKHDDAVRGVAFAAAHPWLFTADRGGGLKVWSLDDGQQLAEAHQGGTIHALAVSPQDEAVASAGNDKTIHLWNAGKLTERLKLEGHRGAVYGLSFHPDGKHLASVGWDRHVRIWETGSGQQAKSWEGHQGDIWCVAYSPDGTKLVTGGIDGLVKVWDAASGKLLQTYSGHQYGVHSANFSDDGKLIVSGGRDGTVQVWAVE